MRKKIGKIIWHQVHLDPHEVKTIKLLASWGYDIELIPVKHDKNRKSADLILQSENWEMKAPQVDGKYTLKHNFRRAGKQAANYLFDLRRLKGNNDQSALSKLLQLFSTSARAKKLWIITKENRLHKYKKIKNKVTEEK